VVLREALGALGSRGLIRLVTRHRPQVVVSTYPVTTEVLGWMRRHGSLDVPAVAVITDLASLRFWAARGIDLHLVTHPESVAEVRRVAGHGAAVRVVRGLVDPAFYEPRPVADARRALGLPAEGGVVIVSGGGWGVGDLEGAVELIAGVPGVAVTVCLCGRNEVLQRRLQAVYGGRPDVIVQGFTTEMSEWLAAGDVLVHSTAGLTVLEAAMRGCAVISYGWNRGHIRLNNQAFVRFGLAAVAHDRRQLRAQVAGIIAAPRPGPSAPPPMPDAAAEILALAGEGRAPGVAGAQG
jgi:UDP-N-acetylglucosamine:LPS N-acetylglucosamine transferase